MNFNRDDQCCNSVGTIARHAVCRNGFTLPELMVVMAIIILLVALIMPVVRSGMDRARDAQCVSNLRTIGMAVTLYARDHGGYYPMNIFPGSEWRRLISQEYLGARTMSSYRPDGMYTQGEACTFTILITEKGAPVADVELDWAISRDGVALFVRGLVKTDAEGKAYFEGTLSEPGFVRCTSLFKLPDGPGLKNIQAGAALGCIALDFNALGLPNGQPRYFFA